MQTDKKKLKCYYQLDVQSLCDSYFKLCSSFSKGWVYKRFQRGAAGYQSMRSYRLVTMVPRRLLFLGAKCPLVKQQVC